jgi:hypothetical protein
VRTVLWHGRSDVLSRLVTTLSSDPDAFYERVKGLRQQFIGDHLTYRIGWTGAFRLRSAAGEMATEWDILPWSAVSGQHIGPPHEDLHDDRTTNRCGWRRRDDDQWTYFVLPEAWRTEVCRGIDGEMTARALADWDLLHARGRT